MSKKKRETAREGTPISSVNAVLVRVAQKREGETFLEHSPVRSSGSNGIIERGIKDVQGQIRSMKSAIDERINTDLSGSSNVLCWLVEFAALLINRYSVGHDGKTPCERLKRKKSNVVGSEFGERVLFRRVHVSAKLAKLDSLWNIEVFVGYRSTTGEYIVVTPEGAWKTRTLRRQPEEERWRREDVESMKYTPWTTNDGATTMESSQEEEVDLGYEIPPMAPEPAEAIPRRVHITRQTLKKYGYTLECAGCTTTFLGGTGVNHSESCQVRIERAMKDDTVDRHRVRNVKRKVREFVQAHMPENLKKLDREEGDCMGDRQEVLLSSSKETSSSSRAIPAGMKTSAEEDAEDLRQGDNESPRTGTKQSFDPDEQEDGDGMLTGYTVDEEADLEFLVGFQGIVKDHCDDDNVSGEIKQRWPTWKIPTQTTCLPMRCTMTLQASSWMAPSYVRRA